MERGCHEEEDGSPPGQHVKPLELVKQIMDGETPLCLHVCVYSQAIRLI